MRETMWKFGLRYVFWFVVIPPIVPEENLEVPTNEFVGAWKGAGTTGSNA